MSIRCSISHGVPMIRMSASDLYKSQSRVIASTIATLQLFDGHQLGSALNALFMYTCGYVHCNTEIQDGKHS